MQDLEPVAQLTQESYWICEWTLQILNEDPLIALTSCCTATLIAHIAPRSANVHHLHRARVGLEHDRNPTESSSPAVASMAQTRRGATTPFEPSLDARSDQLKLEQSKL